MNYQVHLLGKAGHRPLAAFEEQQDSIDYAKHKAATASPNTLVVVIQGTLCISVTSGQWWEDGQSR